MDVIDKLKGLTGNVPGPVMIFAGCLIIICLYTILSRFVTALVISTIVTIGYYIMKDKGTQKLFSDNSKKKWTETYSKAKKVLISRTDIFVERLKIWIKMLSSAKGY